MAYYSPAMNVMMAAARKAARPLIRDFGELENLQISQKSPGDFVTHADKRTEQILIDELTKARPGYGFLGEEGGGIEGKDKSHRFIIDPIDGTSNFLHGIPHFAISIALEREGQLVSGLVFNPVTDEMFTAEKGSGAFLNDKRLRVAARREMSPCLFATGLPSWNALTVCSPRDAPLAWTAAGRVDGFWEHGINIWDTAAGIVLVREAGGIVSDFHGRTDGLQGDEIVCANEHLHPQLLKALKNAVKDAA